MRLSKMVRTEAGCRPYLLPLTSIPSTSPAHWGPYHLGQDFSTAESVCKRYSQAFRSLGICGFTSEIKANCFPLHQKDLCVPSTTPSSLLPAVPMPFLGPCQPVQWWLNTQQHSEASLSTTQGRYWCAITGSYFKAANTLLSPPTLAAQVWIQRLK